MKKQSKITTSVAELQKLAEANQAPSIRQQWMDGLLDGLDPALETDYTSYQEDPVGFVTTILGHELTPDQEALLRAIRDYPIVQVRSATGVGKTFVLACAAIWIYKAYDQAQVYTASAPPETNLKTLLWGEIFGITSDIPLLFEEDSIRSSLLITRHPKQFVVGVSIPKDANEEDIETKWSGKHSPVLVFIFDEGDGIPDPVFRGADGCMSGGVFVRQVVCYNPKKKSGEAYRREIEGSAYVLVMNALDHPNVRTGRNIIPGAVTQNKTIQRIHEWTEPMPIDKVKDRTCWKVPQFLIGAIATDNKGEEYPALRGGWRVIIDTQFYYKVLGDYPIGAADQLIWDNWIDDAVTRWETMRSMNGGTPKPPMGVRPTMGFDVADLGPDKHSLGFRYGGWWDVPETWQDTDPDMAAERAAHRYKEKNAKVARIDATGVGAGVPGKMSRMTKELNFYISAQRIMVGEKSHGWSDEAEGEFGIIRDEAYWAMRTAFRKGTAAIPPESWNNDCRRLHESMKAMTYEIVNGKIKIVPKKILRKKLGYSPDELESFMLSYAQGNVFIGGI